MRNSIFLFIFFIIVVLIGCHHPKSSEKEKAIKVFTPEYAQFFRIEYYDNYKRICILNPWGNEALNINYHIAYQDNVTLQKGQNDFIITKPIKKVVVLSSPMVGLLNILEIDSTIIGVSDPELIYNEQVYQKTVSGEIINVGKNISVNMETLISLQADLIIGSGWDKLSPDFERMIQLKQTPLLMYDWQELHPLGKAEWMILMAAFLNIEEEAMVKFNQLENRYQQLKKSSHYDKQPTIFNGSEYQGIWYSAGGKSYMSQLYKDAGAKYLMKNDSSTGSIMLDFEVIMTKAEKADIWMYTGSTDPASLSLFKNPKYQSIHAVRKHRIYSYHKKINDRGANEYWENASYKPDLVLQDLIKIFHDSEPRNMHYFKKVAY